MATTPVRIVVAVMLGVLAAGPAAGAGEAVRLRAASSLRGALTEIAQAFTRAYGVPVTLEFGASGLLRERLEKGEAGARQVLARPGLAVTSADLLNRMLDPTVKLGTSTPKADPSGDYAWEVFAKADAVRPGSRAVLEQKALQLTGGPASPRPPTNQSMYVSVVEQRLADLFLTYCTNAGAAARQVSGAQVVALPPALRVGADYGLTVLARAERHGFAAPARPARRRRT